MSVKAKDQSGTEPETKTGQGEGSTTGTKETEGGSAGQGAEGGKDSEADESGWDEKTKGYIKNLRSESASHRTKAKSLEGELGGLKDRFSKMESAMKVALGLDEADKLSPEQKVEKLTVDRERIELRNAILESAMANGIGAEDLDYYEFLISKKTTALKDDEELSEEAMSEIVKTVRGKSGKAATTSVTDTDTEKKKPSTPGADEVGIDQFVAMSITEKSHLYSKNPDRYNALMAEARQKNRI